MEKRMPENISFPGGSKSKVNRAGDHVRSNSATTADLAAIDDWRAAHRGVLNTFQAILRTRTRGAGITVAQRHKRRRTIYDKLSRFKKMQLARMDDVAGCRLIFKTIAELHTFRETLHKARFDHRRLNEIDKYDYIKHPKATGYRGIHDVFEYNVRSDVGRKLAGLLVEIQYRTLVQHSWATAVEVVGFVTESQPKFQKGDKRYEQAMAYASEILARVFEGMTGPFPLLTSAEVVEGFQKLDAELGLLRILKGLIAANTEVADNRNVILIFSPEQQLQIKPYKNAPKALQALFDFEKSLPGSDVVLVKATSSEDMRLAFKNYFSDAQDFIERIEQGCKQLTEGAN